MKTIVSLTILLVLINPSKATDEVGTGIESSEPIFYCVSGIEEGGSGISSAEEEGSGVLSSEEPENSVICVIIN